MILVEVGDEVPADAELFSAINLQIDESTLTGEPLATKEVLDNDATAAAQQQDFSCDHTQKPASSHESTYPQNLILRSTMVMNGHGEAVVIRVGDNTEIGKVTILSNENTHVQTPLNLHALFRKQVPSLPLLPLLLFWYTIFLQTVYGTAMTI